MQDGDLVDLEDRIGALDGELVLDGATIRGRGPVRIVIADDEMLMREGLARLLAEAAPRSSARLGTAPSSCARSGSPVPTLRS